MWNNRWETADFSIFAKEVFKGKQWAFSSFLSGAHSSSPDTELLQTIHYYYYHYFNFS